MNGYVSNQASELGSRMSSMENATKNASDMLKRLTLKYNRGRQANITTELTEVCAGVVVVVVVIIFDIVSFRLFLVLLPWMVKKNNNHNNITTEQTTTTASYTHTYTYHSIISHLT